MVGSVMAEQACNARGPSYLRARGPGGGGGGSSARVRSFVFMPLSSGYWGPNTSLLSFTRFCFPYHRPLASGLQAHVHSQEKK